MMVLDQRELDLAGFVGLADGPVPAADIAANIGGAVLDDGEEQTEGEHDKSQGSTESHKILLSIMWLQVGRRFQDSRLLHVNQLFQAEVLESVLAGAFHELSCNALIPGSYTFAYPTLHPPPRLS